MVCLSNLTVISWDRKVGDFNMLVVNVELWPLGAQSEAKSIAKMAIANVRQSVSTNPNHYDYIWVYDEPKPLVGNPVNTYGVVRCYDRNAPVHELIEKVLQGVSGKEQPEIMSDYECIVAKKMNERITS